MSFLSSSAASSSSLAAISLELSSRTSDPSQMMRSLSRRSKTLGWNVGSAMGWDSCLEVRERIYRRGAGLMTVFASGRVGCMTSWQDEVDAIWARADELGDRGVMDAMDAL